MAPFTVSTQVVIKGGGLSEAWAVDTRLVDGLNFFVVSKSDRKLAKALGFSMKDRAPFKDVNVFGYIEKERDNYVDKAIVQHMVEEDPMGDSSGGHARLASRGREKMFAAAKVPEVIVLHCPPFTSGDGVRVDAFELKIISTPRRGANACIACDPTTLDWLAKAATADWGVTSSPSKRGAAFADLPQLPNPEVCKYRRVNGKLSVYCNYRQEDGRWLTHQRAVATEMMSEEDMSQVVSSAALTVMKFYEANHMPGDPDEASVDVSGEP